MSESIRDMIAAAVEGPYRIVLSPTLPYVRIAPATASDSITVRSSPGLRLAAHSEPVRRLSGVDDVLDCTLVSIGDSQLLQDLGRRATLLDSIDPQHPLSQRQWPGHGVPRRAFRLGTIAVAPAPEGGAATVVRAPKPKRPATPSLVVTPQGSPSPREVSVPAILQPIIEAEKVHSDLGDYLVIPSEAFPELTTLPPWVVRYPVAQIRVVKPRLNVDRPLGGLTDGTI